jgi:hypothetical protein
LAEILIQTYQDLTDAWVFLNTPAIILLSFTYTK